MNNSPIEQNIVEEMANLHELQVRAISKTKWRIFQSESQQHFSKSLRTMTQPPEGCLGTQSQSARFGHATDAGRQLCHPALPGIRPSRRQLLAARR